MPRAKGKITYFLILLCAFIFALSLLPQTQASLRILFFSESAQSLFPEILQGQVWRIWTPILLHFGILHIIFNMLWLKDLGSITESFQGPGFFLFFLLFVGGLSNIGQYLISGPSFGGMSGVVYGLLGYLWSYRKFHSFVPYFIPKEDIVMMIIWFVLCAVGLLGPIANMAHAIGLGVGMLLGMFLGALKHYREVKRFFAKSFLIHFLLAWLFMGGTLLLEVYKRDGRLFLLFFL